ncbi:phage protein NinX family protein [Paraburkholderia xenovorans]
MKVSELVWPQLDVWVCRAELEVFQGMRLTPELIDVVKSKIGYYPYFPSMDSAIAFPIIERERIALFPAAGDAGAWMAQLQTDGRSSQFGPTALVAAMRCFVWSKYGEEVPA